MFLIMGKVSHFHVYNFDMYDQNVFLIGTL